MPDLTSQQYLAKLVRSAASKQESEPRFLVAPSEGPVTITLPRERTLVNGRIEIQGIQLDRIEPNANGDIFIPARPGRVVSPVRWWPEVIVSRITPSPAPEVPGEVYARTNQGAFEASEEPGWGVVNVRGLGVNEIEAELVFQRDRARQSILAEEDRRILEALDQLGRDGLQPTETVPPAPGNYGWHRDSARLPPRYIEPSYVNAPARVRLPEFEIMANPTIQLDDIRERRFGIRGDPPQVVNPPPRKVEHTNGPRPYCPSVWERLLGVDPV